MGKDGMQFPWSHIFNQVPHLHPTKTRLRRFTVWDMEHPHGNSGTGCPLHVGNWCSKWLQPSVLGNRCWDKWWLAIPSQVCGIWKIIQQHSEKGSGSQGTSGHLPLMPSWSGWLPFRTNRNTQANLGFYGICPRSFCSTITFHYTTFVCARGGGRLVSVRLVSHNELGGSQALPRFSDCIDVGPRATGFNRWTFRISQWKVQEMVPSKFWKSICDAFNEGKHQLGKQEYVSYRIMAPRCLEHCPHEVGSITFCQWNISKRTTTFSGCWRLCCNSKMHKDHLPFRFVAGGWSV